MAHGRVLFFGTIPFKKSHLHDFCHFHDGRPLGNPLPLGAPLPLISLCLFQVNLIKHKLVSLGCLLQMMMLLLCSQLWNFGMSVRGWSCLWWETALGGHGLTKCREGVHLESEMNVWGTLHHPWVQCCQWVHLSYMLQVVNFFGAGLVDWTQAFKSLEHLIYRAADCMCNGPLGDLVVIINPHVKDPVG